MAKRKNRSQDFDRRVEAVSTPRQTATPIQETRPRSIDTGQQMRDALRVARANNARRFAERVIAQRLEALRHLETEDLRRNRYEVSQIASQAYRRTDGRPAAIRWQPVRQDRVRGGRVPVRMRTVFQDASHVLVCARRQARRRVIFALQLHGQGGARRRKNVKARWTDRSYIVCRGVR